MLIIVDCNYVAHSQKFALSSGLVYRGGRTEIIFGFLRTIFNLARKFGTGRFIFCWDSKESLRRKIYPEYKMNRKKDLTEDEKEADRIAYEQFDRLKLILQQMGFANIFEEVGYESDDIIASLVINSKEDKIVVVSTDKDLYQLLNCCVLCNVRGEVYTRNMFIREYRINPSGWKKVKAIAGCSSDNVQGVSGVGEKTAIKYLRKEMKQTGKTYQRIATYDSSMTERLVMLPFEGCPDFKKFVLKDKLTKDKFESVFRKYGFDTFLKCMDKLEGYFLRRENENGF